MRLQPSQCTGAFEYRVLDVLQILWQVLTHILVQLNSSVGANGASTEISLYSPLPTTGIWLMLSKQRHFQPRLEQNFASGARQTATRVLTVLQFSVIFEPSDVDPGPNCTTLRQFDIPRDLHRCLDDWRTEYRSRGMLVDTAYTRQLKHMCLVM